MSSRTSRTMIAEAFGEEIEYKTAGGYSFAGVLMYPDVEKNFPRAVVAVGHSHASVTKRTRTISRRVRPGLLKSDEYHVMQVVTLVEATAPVVRDYFETNKVSVTGWYTPETGWVYGHRSAGRTELRKMAREGIVTVQVSKGNGRPNGRRDVDFGMAELLKSMNARKKA